MRDVAQKANVSVGTVSNVLNMPEMVATSTRQRVLRAIEQTGFVRNGAARQLRGGGSKAVGIIVMDFSNPFFTELMRGAEDALHKEGYVLIACSTDESTEREAQYLELLEEHRAEGVLVTPTSTSLEPFIKMRNKGIPVVLVDRQAETDELCSITVDDRKGGGLALDHLLEQGHRRILFINGPDSIRQCHDRRLGAELAAKRAAESGIDIELTHQLAGSLTIASGEEAARQVLPYWAHYSAIMCANDLLAIGVLRGLSSAGLDIPGDISLVGYDDIMFSAMISPSLSSVRQPQYDLGFAAARLLLEELSDVDHRHREIRFTPILIVRESTSMIQSESLVVNSNGLNLT